MGSGVQVADGVPILKQIMTWLTRISAVIYTWTKQCHQKSGMQTDGLCEIPLGKMPTGWGHVSGF